MATHVRLLQSRTSPGTNSLFNVIGALKERHREDRAEEDLTARTRAIHAFHRIGSTFRAYANPDVVRADRTPAVRWESKEPAQRPRPYMDHAQRCIPPTLDAPLASRPAPSPNATARITTAFRRGPVLPNGRMPFVAARKDQMDGTDRAFVTNPLLRSRRARCLPRPRFRDRDCGAGRGTQMRGCGVMSCSEARI